MPVPVSKVSEASRLTSVVPPAAVLPTASLLATSGADQRPRAAAFRRRAALGVLVSAQLVVMLDTSIVNVALPSIQEDLGLGQTGVAWVVNAYFLAFGGFLLLSGRAADVVGRRAMFMAGAALFTAATVAAALAGDEALLIGARVAQGLGAAVLSPAAMSLLLVHFPGQERARAMGVWGAASTLGGATGVLAGGLITGWFGWSGVFYLTVPVSLGALLLAPRLFAPGTASGVRRFDVPGAASVTGAALALIYAVLAVPDHGWRSPHSLGGLGAATLLIAVFVLVERTSADPLVPLDLLRSRPVAAGTLLALLGGAARASSFVLIALLLQQALAYEPEVAGLAMVPTSVAGFVVSLTLLPRVLRRLGPPRTTTLGLVVLAAGHLWLARSPGVPSYVVGVLPGLLLVAAGVALSFTPTTMVVASGVPLARSGLASGLAGTGTQVGAALGVSVFTAVAAAVTATASARSGDAEVTRAALAAGFQAAFTAAATVALVAAALGAVLLGRGRAEH